MTNHAHVLLAVARNSEVRVEEIAEAAGITQRSVYRILAELAGAGYVRRTKVGRHNHYDLASGLPLDDPVAAALTVDDLLLLIDDRRP
jgi:DNA-binding IclR family transcriptional regulator